MAQIDAANTVEKKVVHTLSHIEKWTSEQIEQCTVLGERRLACVSETEKEHTLLNCKEALKAVLTKLVAPDGGTLLVLLLCVDVVVLFVFYVKDRVE